MELRVVVKQGKSGYYVARVPALKGCWSQGATIDEAISNIKEAATLWLEVEQEKRARGASEKSETFAVQL